MSNPEASSSEQQAQKAAVYRRAGGRRRLVRELSFDKLPEVVLERLDRGIRLGAAPDPIVSTAARPGPGPRFWGGVAAASTLGLGVAWMRGFGDLESPWAMPPIWFAAIYGVLFALAGLALNAAWAGRAKNRGAPFPPGAYLYPLDLVEITGRRLRLTSLDTLRRVEARAGAIALVFEEGADVLLRLPRGGDAGEMAARAETATKAARGLDETTEADTLERVDPFFELRIAQDWGSAAPAAKAGCPMRARLTALAVVLAAAPAGFGLWKARLTAGDQALFDEASRPFAGKVEPKKLTRYAVLGERHLDEAKHLLASAALVDRDVVLRLRREPGRAGEMVRDALFEASKEDPAELAGYLRGPRGDAAEEALFALTRRQNTVEAYADYLRQGQLAHTREVREELWPEAEYQRAKSTRLVGALFGFLDRHPASPHADEIRGMIREDYANAIPTLRKHVGVPDGDTRFAEAMIARLLANADSRVDLDIRSPDPAALASADEALAKKYPAGLYLPAASRFEPHRLHGLIEHTRSAVGTWFGLAFGRATAETSVPSMDERRPSFQIDLVPVIDGVAEWRSTTTKEVKRMSPVVGLTLIVHGTVPGPTSSDPPVTIEWRAHLEDKTDSKMQTKTSRGEERDQSEQLEDAFGAFLEQVPGQVASSFRELGARPKR